MVVDIVEEVEADPAYGLLPHDGLVQDSTQNVRNDGRRVLNSLTHGDQLFHLPEILIRNINRLRKEQI